jgi:asparagine synthase (glutamine-hydrolysing)
MCAADGRLVMVFNGEVYNFAGIRRELENMGHVFAGTGDSEVVLAAFAQWGIAAVQRFIGMFAIALWDTHARSLTLLRDRLGVKPLYYGWDGCSLWFGSELKALRAYQPWQPEVDRDAMAEYFRYGYINAPHSIYRHVHHLPPGHSLELGQEGSPRVTPYWSVLDALQSPLQGGEDELAKQLEALLIDAFRLRMVSDVPVGVFLSGGVDSSLVAAILQRHMGEQIHTFTIGFNEARFNEAPHAARVAAQLGTRHTERILEMDEVRRILPKWGSLYDEPFADASGIPTFLVSKIASEQVKVVLSADGGDELFCGYSVYPVVIRHVQMRARIPEGLRRLLAAGGSLVQPRAIDAWLAQSALPDKFRHVIRERLTWRARRAQDYLAATGPGAMFEQAISHWQDESLVRLTGGAAQTRAGLDGYPGELAEQMCLWDLHNYLPGDVLAKVDRASMAVSIEGREPLLDHRIAEFAFRLPLPMRLGALGNKHLLRKILYKYVPRDIVDRPKMGFEVPILHWLRSDLRYLMDEYLSPGAIRRQSLLEPREVERAVMAFRRGDDREVRRVWTLLAFQMWQRRWVEG